VSIKRYIIEGIIPNTMELLYSVLRVIPTGTIYLSGSASFYLSGIPKDHPHKHSSLWRPLKVNCFAKETVPVEKNLAFLSEEGKLFVASELDPLETSARLTYSSLPSVRTLYSSGESLYLITEEGSFLQGNINRVGFADRASLPVFLLNYQCLHLPPLTLVRASRDNVALITETGLLYYRDSPYYDSPLSAYSAQSEHWARITLPPLRDLVFNVDYALALTRSGALYDLGHPLFAFTRNQSFKKCKFSRVKQVAIGSGHALLLTEEGVVYVRGYNDSGQLGRNDFIDREEWVRTKHAPLNIKKIIAGKYQSLLLTETGKLYVVGWNKNGCLGVFSCNERRKWEEVSLIKGVQKVSSGTIYTVAIV